jgi:hypothetical protein
MALATITELTEGKIDGNGAFDKLMAAARVHLDREFKEQRIRGPEYSQVYLGMLEQCLGNALTFMVQGATIDLQRELLEQQVIVAKIEAEKAAIEKLKVQAELEILEAQKPKILAEVALLEAQVVQMEAENALIPKKAALMDSEVLYKAKQGELITSQVANSIKEGELIDSQKSKIAQEVINMAADKLGIDARTTLTTNQAANAVIEGTVLVAQECKLRAEFDHIMNQMTKTTSEINLLVQKTMTEKAQTQAIGVDTDSVIGKQKVLYEKQAKGFDRDAEQKAAKIIIDTWNARRMTDEGTVADGTNKLNDVTVGAFVEKLKQGIQA